MLLIELGQDSGIIMFMRLIDDIVADLILI